MTPQGHLEVGALTDTGRVRERNEDTIGTAALMQVAREHRERKGELLAVADGIGGHSGGDVASKLAIETLYQRYYGDPSTDLATSLRRAVEAANQEVFAQGQAMPGSRSMGTTLVAAVLHGDRLIVANVGDSRAYLARDRRLRQLTRDHSWVAESVAAGYISEEEARQSARRNLVTRSLGQRPDVRVDIFREQLRAADAILLCSDGLTNEVSDAEIARALSGRPSQVAAESLVALAKQRGGRDNISVVISRLPSRESRPFLLRPVVMAAAAGLVFVACMVLVALLAVGPLVGSDREEETPTVAVTDLQTTESPPTSGMHTGTPVQESSTPAPTAVPSATPTQTATPPLPETLAPTPTDTPQPTASDPPAPTDTPKPEASDPPTPTMIPFAEAQVKLPLYAGCPSSPTKGCTPAEAQAGLADIFDPDLKVGAMEQDPVYLTVTPLLCVKGEASVLNLEKMPGFLQASLSLEVQEGSASQRYLVHMWSLWPVGAYPSDPAQAIEMTVCGRPSAQRAEPGGERVIEAEIVIEWHDERGPVPWLLPQGGQAPLWLAGKGEDLGPWSCWPVLPGEMDDWVRIAELGGRSLTGGNWILSYAQWDSADSDCGQGFRPVRLGQAGPAVFWWSGQDYLHLLGEIGG